MKRIFVSLFFFFLLFISVISSPVSAKTASVAVNGQYIKRINVVRAYFGGLKGVKRVNYTLMYEVGGVGQGVIGGFSPGKKTAISKDIYLGTCSGRVCTPHWNVKNIRLEAAVQYTNGKSSTKTVKIK